MNVGSIIVGGIGGIVVGAIAVWAVLRNNPKFLYRHMEHWIELKAKEAIDKGWTAAEKNLEGAKEDLKRLVDRIT